MTLDKLFNLAVPQFLIHRIGERSLTGLLGRVNEILVHFVLDGVLDLMRFSIISNVPIQRLAQNK